MKSSALLWLIVASAALVGFSGQPAFAQDGKSSIKLPVPGFPKSQPEPMTQPVPGFKFQLPPIIPPAPDQGSRRSGHEALAKYQERLGALGAAQFVVKDGTALLSIRLPGQLIPIPINSSAKLIAIPTDITASYLPVAGGCKSGCRGVDSKGPVIKLGTQYNQGLAHK